MSNLPKLVVMGRDGVINESTGDTIRSVADWKPLPGSLEAIARLNHAGVAVAVATNQASIGLGLIDIEELNRIHQHFRHTLARVGGHVDGIFFCPHPPDSPCDCRKPAPGLLRGISQRFGVPLQRVPVIGNKRPDAEAAHAARARPMMVRTGVGAAAFDSTPELRHLPWFDDLSDVVDQILSEGASA